MNSNPPGIWRVGQKVVCINDAFSRAVLDWCDHLPRAGCVYTIRAMQLGRNGVTGSGCLGFLLEGVVNPLSSLGREVGFVHTRFMPWLESVSEAENHHAVEPVHELQPN